MPSISLTLRGAPNVQTVAHKKESLIRLLSGFLNLSCFGGFFGTFAFTAWFIIVYLDEKDS